ncbi:MAG: hypothetical protein ACYC2K_11110, partial [Gemmatimonadales bacterium]
MPRSTQTTLVAAVTVAAGTLLAGCASGPALAELDLPERDKASWVMPLDEYFFPSAIEISSYAQNLLQSECMQEAGFEWPIMPVPLEDSDYEGVMTMLTLDAAQAQGYHEAPSADRTAGIENFTKMNALAQSQPGFDTVFTPCLEELRAEHPILGRAMKSHNFV